MKKLLLLSSLVFSVAAFANEKKEEVIDKDVIEKPVVKYKKVSVDLINASLQYMSGRKLSEVLNVFTKVKSLAETHLKQFPNAKEVSLPEADIQSIMGLMRQEPMFKLYMALQAAPYDQTEKPAK